MQPAGSGPSSSMVMTRPSTHHMTVRPTPPVPSSAHPYASIGSSSSQLYPSITSGIAVNNSRWLHSTSQVSTPQNAQKRPSTMHGGDRRAAMMQRLNVVGGSEVRSTEYRRLTAPGVVEPAGAWGTSSHPSEREDAPSSPLVLVEDTPTPRITTASNSSGRAFSATGSGLSAPDAALKQERERHRIELDTMWKKHAAAVQALNMELNKHDATKSKLRSHQAERLLEAESLMRSRISECALQEELYLVRRMHQEAADTYHRAHRRFIEHECPTVMPPLRDSDLLRALRGVQLTVERFKQELLARGAHRVVAEEEEKKKMLALSTAGTVVAAPLSAEEMVSVAAIAYAAMPQLTVSKSLTGGVGATNAVHPTTLSRPQTQPGRPRKRGVLLAGTTDSS